MPHLCQYILNLNSNCWALQNWLGIEHWLSESSQITFNLASDIAWLYKEGYSAELIGAPKWPVTRFFSKTVQEKDLVLIHCAGPQQIIRTKLSLHFWKLGAAANVIKK